MTRHEDSIGTALCHSEACLMFKMCMLPLKVHVALDWAIWAIKIACYEMSSNEFGQQMFYR